MVGVVQKSLYEIIPVCMYFRGEGLAWDKADRDRGVAKMGEERMHGKKKTKQQIELQMRKGRRTMQIHSWNCIQSYKNVLFLQSC